MQCTRARLDRDYRPENHALGGWDPYRDRAPDNGVGSGPIRAQVEQSPRNLNPQQMPQSVAPTRLFETYVFQLLESAHHEERASEESRAAGRSWDR